VTQVELESRIAVYEEVKVWSKKWSWRSLRYVRFCSLQQRMRYRKYASNAPEIELQSSALHPHARAAGTPTGGSLFYGSVCSWRAQNCSAFSREAANGQCGLKWNADKIKRGLVQAPFS
jgi:hypothetical protein